MSCKKFNFHNFLQNFLTKTVGTTSCGSRRVFISLCVRDTAEKHWGDENRVEIGEKNSARRLELGEVGRREKKR